METVALFSNSFSLLCSLSQSVNVSNRCTKPFVDGLDKTFREDDFTKIKGKLIQLFSSLSTPLEKKDFFKNIMDLFPLKEWSRSYFQK